MKKGILIIGLIFAGMGLVQVKLAQAQTTDMHTNIQDVRARVVASFAANRPRAYALEASAQAEGESNHFGDCSAHSETSACRQALPQLSECQQQCEEDYPDHNHSTLAQTAFDSCVFWCSYSSLRDEKFRTDEKVLAWH